MRAILALCLIVLGAAGPALADQRDPRLPVLFSALIDAGPVDARRIEGEIWMIWIESSDGESAELMQLGMLAMQTGELDVALDTFDLLVTRSPDFAEAWNKRATVLYMVGDLEASLADIAKTLELEPHHFGALSGAGLIFDALEQPEPALKAYREALAVHPNLPYAQMRAFQLEQELDGLPL